MLATRFILFPHFPRGRRSVGTKDQRHKVANKRRSKP